METLNAIKKVFSILEREPWKSLSTETRERCMAGLIGWLENLSSEERDLAVSLLDQYTLIPFEKYEVELDRCLMKLVSMLDVTNDTFFLPIIKNGQEGYHKSGSALEVPLYMQLSRILGKDIRQIFRWCRSIAKLSGLPDKKCNIIIVDDYIGSGLSLESVLRSYRSKFLLRNDKIMVLCFAIHESGFYRICELQNELNLDIDLVATRFQPFGIKGNDRIIDKDWAYSIIGKLESRMGVSDDRKLGFQKCEDLITLMRTPNNTLPMFWYKASTISGWEAPFARI